jgi:hypothetical protein
MKKTVLNLVSLRNLGKIKLFLQTVSYLAIVLLDDLPHGFMIKADITIHRLVLENIRME